MSLLKVAHGVGTVVLIVWSILAMVGSGAFVDGEGWVLGVALTGLAGALTVLGGALHSHKSAQRGGRLVIVGASVASGCIGALIAMTQTDDWWPVLAGSSGAVTVLGGIPIAIGAEMRRRGGATRVGLPLRLPRRRRPRTSESSP